MKLRISLIATSLTGAVLLLGHSLQAQTNLLNNPTWATGDLSDWSTSCSVGSASDVTVTSNDLGGNYGSDAYFLQFDASPNPMNCYVYQTLTGQTSGASFTATVYGRLTNANNAYLQVQDGLGGTTLCTTDLPSTDTTYAQYTCTGTVPSDGQLTFELGSGNNTSSSAWVNFDSASLTVSSSGITYPSGTTYYISNNSCSDSNAGTSSDAPWCTFNNVNGNTFSPGDTILLAAGSTWNQELDLLGTGTSSGWITVSSYGDGTKPIINRNDTTSGTLRCVRLTNPDYWNIENLEVLNAGSGILVEFTTPNHNGLNISNIYAANMTGINLYPSNVTGVPATYSAAPGVADNIPFSAGIIFTGPSGSFTLTSGQYTLNGFTINNVEGTNNGDSVLLYGPIGGNGTSTWDFWNGLVQSVYGHQDWYPGNGSFEAASTSNTTIMDSVFTDPVGPANGGTIASCAYFNNNLVLMNSMATDVPFTNSNDGAGWDNDADNYGNGFYGDYFANNAGAGMELANTSYNTTISSNLFVNNGGGSESGSEGALFSGEGSGTGAASQNLYYEPSYGFDNGDFSDYTFTNNLAADSQDHTWNAMSGFSNTQAQNQWSYQYYNGSWNNMGTYDTGSNLYNSSWSSGTGAYIYASSIQPDACSSCWVGRAWTAPQAGDISIRGWAAMTGSGGNGVVVNITQNTNSIWGGNGTSLVAGNTTGFSTNADVTVAQGDVIRFRVNNGGSGNNTEDQVSWSPNIIYTSSYGPSNLLLTNPTWATGDLSDWSTSCSVGSASDVTVTSNDLGGNYGSDAYFLQFDASPNPMNCYVYQTLTGQTSGASFTATVYGRLTNANNAYLQVQDGLGGTTLCTTDLPSTDTTYAQYTCTGTVPSDGQLTFELGSGNNTSSSAWVNFDSASLTLP